MPYALDSPPEAASKYSPKCQRAFVHAFNSVHEKTHDEGKSMAAGHAAARQCEGKRSAMGDIKFEFVTGIVKAFDGGDEKKRVVTTASSTIRDLSGDTMTLKALQRMAQTAEDNMTIWLNHKYEVPEDVFGSVEKATINQRGDNWDLDFLIRVEDGNERALKTYQQILGGTKLGTSVGALIPAGGAKRSDDGLLIDDVMLLEASLVGIPANPRSYAQYALKAYHDAELELDEDPSEVEPPFEGAVWDTKARVWVTIDSDPPAEEEASQETKSDGKAKAKATKSVDADVIANAEVVDEAGGADATPPADDPTDTSTDGPSDGEDSADGDKAASEQSDTDAPATQEAPSDESVPESDGDGDESASELLSRSIDVIQKAYEATRDELVETRAKLASETSLRATAERELVEHRDALKLAQRIVERIAALPIGRRAGFTEEVTGFRTKFSGLYDEEFLKIAEKK